MADFQGKSREIRVGDIVRGKANNGYSFTNKKMQKAKVISVNDKFMKIEVLEHSEKCHIGNVFDVRASTERFEIIEKENEQKCVKE